MRLEEARKELRKYSSKKQAKALQRFFKTGKGEYAQGDIFLGVRVPDARKVCLKFQDLPVKETFKLLRSPIHEERLLSLLILIRKYAKASEKEKANIFNSYLKHTKFINNWDLVDLSAHHIVGAFIINKDKKLLYQLAKSNLLWERRIAVLATFYFIKNRKFVESLKISELLISDKHDLIHKAVGWMLRELGKRDQPVEEAFLDKHAHLMPRTMLRYAIERFPEEKRKKYLKGKI